MAQLRSPGKHRASKYDARPPAKRLPARRGRTEGQRLLGCIDSSRYQLPAWTCLRAANGIMQSVACHMTAQKLAIERHAKKEFLACIR